MKSGTVFDNMEITDDPAEAKAAGKALWALPKDAEKKMMDQQEEGEKYKDEAKDAEKGEAEDDEGPDDIGKDEKEEVKEDADKEEEKAKHRLKQETEKPLTSSRWRSGWK